MIRLLFKRIRFAELNIYITEIATVIIESLMVRSKAKENRTDTKFK
jgi:hypothetical protein